MKDEDKSCEGIAASRYEALFTDRQIFLMRARECALLTIPMLFPPQGHSSATRYYTPFQSLGARGVNNLASKLLLALLPPESCFFRLEPTPEVEQEVESAPGAQPDDMDKLDEALSGMEQKVLKEINKRSVRVHAFEAFKQLIIGGNTLVYLPPKKGIRVFRLDQYVVSRDPEGNVLEIVTKEVIAPQALPKSVREQVLAMLKNEATSETQATQEYHKTVDLYTWVRLDEDGGKWKIEQEVKGICIPGSEGTYPLDKCPWLPLRWTRIDGESYGRGLCEEYLGDLSSFETLSKTLVQAGGVAGKVLIMVKPNGTTRVEDMADKPNGAIIAGDPEDVKAFQLEKNMDLQFVSNLAQGIEQRISYAFLLNSSVQRDGERVTAEEIKYMASELEDALGGVYSLLADDFQLPLAVIVLSQMERDGKLPPLPDGTVDPTVITGLDALGRNHEGSRLDQLVTQGFQTFGPTTAQYINVGDWFSRKAASLGIREKGLIKTDQEVQQAQAAQQQMELAGKLGGPAMQAGAKIQTAQMQQQPDQQQESNS